jgi:hypothetical protein
MRERGGFERGNHGFAAMIVAARSLLLALVDAGMLEHPSLLLMPWTTARGSPGNSFPRRPILEADTGRPLGFVGRAAARLPWGLGWLVRPAYEVRETEDESLLFILYGPWFTQRAWEVYDAEERVVGSLRGNLIRDRYGRTLAAAEPTPGGGFGFPEPEGEVLGTLEPVNRGHRMTFGEVLIGDPFARMLLLAGGLALTHSHA